MTLEKASAKLLESLRQKANRRTTSPKATQDWERIIQWEIDRIPSFWKVTNGGIQTSEVHDPQIVLRCTYQTLEKLVSGELPFFIAIWATGELQYEGSFADAMRLGYIFLTDKRGRRVVFLAHCFLNMNTRFPGGCAFEGATIPLIETLLQSGVGIVQMPCPEFLCLGLEKERYGELSETELRQCFRRLAEGVVDQIAAYVENGYKVAGIIGMNPSPSCGVEITKGQGTMLGKDRDTSEKEGSGVFIEELKGLATERNLENLPFFGIRRMLPGEGGLHERLGAVQQRLLR
jgi:predicted secreted protein/putative sterol carrier protein